MPVPQELLLDALDTLAREFPTLPIVVCGHVGDGPAQEEEAGAASWAESTAEFSTPS